MKNYMAEVLTDQPPMAEIYAFQREVLGNPDPGHLMRGPESYANGLWTYRNTVTGDLARMVVQDGEGFTRGLEVRVRGAATPADALQIARTVATSTLVRCAITGGDPNWGRIVAAAGAPEASPCSRTGAQSRWSARPSRPPLPPRP